MKFFKSGYEVALDTITKVTWPGFVGGFLAGSATRYWNILAWPEILVWFEWTCWGRREIHRGGTFESSVTCERVKSACSSWNTGSWLQSPAYSEQVPQVVRCSHRGVTTWCASQHNCILFHYSSNPASDSKRRGSVWHKLICICWLKHLILNAW